MGWIKPRTILQLTITGFLAVTGILIVALLVTIQQLDGLSTRGQLAVNQTTVAMAASRALLEQTTAMERNARQFSIIGDREILNIYADRHRRFTDATARLRLAALTPALTAQVDDIETLEAAIFDDIETVDSQQLDSLYRQLSIAATAIADAVNSWAGLQATTIQQESADTKRLLSIQAIVLVAVAIVLAGVFTALITRPLIQVEKVIDRLGGGHYKQKIRISGPKDLVELGQRLDWLRERMSTLEQQRSSFLRHVSHELKTPLAAIQESTSLFRDGVVGDLTEQQIKLIGIQSNSVQRLHVLIDDLLRHHADSYDVISKQPVAIRIDKLVSDVVKNHEPSAQSKTLDMKLELPVLTVFGNPEQIRVIVDNLLSNAIRFSPVSGCVAVTLEQREKHVCVNVIDQGPGVPEHDTERVFEAFYQGPQNKDASYKGSGLGLAIVKEYVTSNNGCIKIIPTDSGAHFQVCLPVA